MLLSTDLVQVEVCVAEERFDVLEVSATMGAP
jgi:hypothetical protein